MSETMTARGFAVDCPHCNEKNSLRLDIDDLTLVCTNCEEEVTRDELRAVIDEARRLLAWLDLAATV